MGAWRRFGTGAAVAVSTCALVCGLQVTLQAPAGANGSPGTLTCVSTISGVQYTVVASLSGVVQIGGFLPDSLTGNCTMEGDNTGTLDIESGLTSLIAADGSQNDGTIAFVGDDATFTGSGTFTNNGSVVDDAPGFVQSVTIPDFVNLGSVSAAIPSGASSGPSLEIADGSATAFDNQGTVSAGSGSTIEVWGGSFTLEPTGSVTAGPGTFGVGDGGSMTVNGGTVTGGSVQEIEFLGTCPSSFDFAVGIPNASSGDITGSCPVSLSGTVPSNWTFGAGGNLTLAPGTVNDGALQLDGGNLTVSDTGTFTNNGSITDTSTGNVQDLAVADLVNLGTVEAAGPGLELAGGAAADVFDDQGDVVVDSGATMTVSEGTFQLDTGGTVAAAGGEFQLADYSTLDVTGGSVTSGVVTTHVSLGVGPSVIAFGSPVPTGTSGTIDLTAPVTLEGTIASGWTVDVASGTLTAAPGSGNEGTLVFDGSQSFTGAGTFTNAGSFEAQQFVNVTIASFTTAASGSVSDTAGGPLTFSPTPANLVGGTLTGGTWTAAGRINLGGAVSTDDASLTVSGTGEFASQVVLSTVTDALGGLADIESGASLTLTGGADETISSGLVNDGTITTGSNDRLSVGGSLTEGGSATFATTLAGTVPGQTFGAIAVDGGASLAGTLAVSQAAGYEPGPTDTQAVVTGSPVSGAFLSVEGQTSTAWGHIVATYSPLAATLSILSLGLTTTTTSTGYGAAGNAVGLEYRVTNDTTVTVSGIAIDDPLVPAADITCPSSSLASGAGETCTGTYTATQADVDAGSITDTATASAEASPDITLTSPPSVLTVSASGATSGISIETSTASDGYRGAGDALDLQYKVTNTGTRMLSAVGVDDSLLPTGSVSCPSPTLAPGTSETCTGTYTVTQADVDAGSITDTATATATDSRGTGVTSPTSSLTVDALVTAHVAFVGSAQAPELVITGSGFGTAPTAVPACKNNSDYAGGSLWVEDATTTTTAGEPGDCLGLKIKAYTGTEVVLAYGSEYHHYPPLAAGDQYIVDVNGGTFTGTVTYGAPLVTQVAPTSGPLAGGTKVKVRGVGLSGATAVTFGSVAATSFTLNKAGTLITAVAPAGSAGSVDITVTTPRDTSPRWAGDRYTYQASA